MLVLLVSDMLVYNLPKGSKKQGGTGGATATGATHTTPKCGTAGTHTRGGSQCRHGGSHERVGGGESRARGGRGDRPTRGANSHIGGLPPRTARVGLSQSRRLGSTVRNGRLAGGAKTRHAERGKVEKRLYLAEKRGGQGHVNPSLCLRAAAPPVDTSVQHVTTPSIPHTA